jgi:hypothetical protein
MAKQIHQAKLRVTCDLEIPQYQKNKGIEIELRANNAPLGELQIMGAHVYFRATHQRKWSHWTFSEFVRLLEDNRNA